VLQSLLHSLWQKKQVQDFPTWLAKILRHELVNSHKYFSKWIEEKEKKVTAPTNGK
jgi:DNA-directed RNA polymerase specialized sigma24 family protein